MEALRRWFGKSRSKDKPKPAKRKETVNGKEGSKLVASEEAPSNATKQKAAAAKQYIEKHYKEQMKNLQERRERYDLYFLFDCNWCDFCNECWTKYIFNVFYLIRSF